MHADHDRDRTLGRRLLAAVITAGALGIGLLVLQRWVAATFVAAVVLVVVWFVVVAVAALVLGHLRPGLRGAMLLTVGAIAVASAGIGYWTGFRKTEVNENVAMASSRISERDRAAALAGSDGTATTDAASAGTGDKARAERRARGERAQSKRRSARKRTRARKRRQREKASQPTELGAGGLSGADGHAATGTATVIRQSDGERVLTLTDLDADPGPDVNVYLSTSTNGIDVSIDLGSLKGSVGNQQYDIPANADLSRYENVVLYCIPFTTRIATAELG